MGIPVDSTLNAPRKFLFHFRRVVEALPYVANPVDALGHIVWPDRRPTVEYRLKSGARLQVGGRSQDRTALLTVKEIFGDAIYRMPLETASPVIVDLGANIGIYSLYAAAQYPGATLYAVEPDGDNFARLQENIAINRLKDRITPLQAAASGSDGEVTFYRNPNSSRGHSAVFVSPDAVQVAAVSLRSLFERFQIERCHILKVDIEGAEYDVFFHCPEDILERIDHIVLEHHQCFPGDPKRNPEGLKRFLTGKGFVAVAEAGAILRMSRSRDTLAAGGRGHEL